jgi:hypothetical protein
MYYYPYLISMVLTGANLFLAIFVMRETLQEKNRTPISWAIANPFDKCVLRPPIIDAQSLHQNQ